MRRFSSGQLLSAVALAAVAAASLVLWISAKAPTAAPQSPGGDAALYEQVAQLQQQIQRVQDIQEQQHQQSLLHEPQHSGHQDTTLFAEVTQGCGSIWSFSLLMGSNKGESCKFPMCSGYRDARKGGNGTMIVTEFGVDGLTNLFNLQKNRMNCHAFQMMLYDGQIGSVPFFYILAWVLIIQWHLRFRFFTKFITNHMGWPVYRVKAMRSLKKLGLNIVITFQYFGPKSTHILSGPRPFICAVIAISLDTFVLFYLFKAIPKEWQANANHDVTYKDPDQASTPGDDLEDDGYTDDKDAASNVYENLTIQLRKVLPVFFCQIALGSFYVEELNNGTNVKTGDDTTVGMAILDPQKLDAWFLLVAVVFQMFASEAELGTNFTEGLWSKYLVAAFPEKMEKWFEAVYTKITKDDEGDGGGLVKGMKQLYAQEQTAPHYIFFYIPFPRHYEVLLRMFMDFIINGMMRALIMYTFPIILCVEGPLDFVKDCTAVLFISSLDDLGDGEVPLQQITAILKIQVMLRLGASIKPAGDQESGSSQALIRNAVEFPLEDKEKDDIKDNEDKYDQLKGQWNDMVAREIAQNLNSQPPPLTWDRWVKKEE